MEETKFNHSAPIQIRFNDVDGLGHINNTTIQEYFDLGRMYYMTAVFDEAIFKSDETLIVVNINTDFISPIYLRDCMEVKTAIVGLGNKSLKMEQQIVCAKTKAVKAVCKSVMVGFNKTTEEGLELKPKWREQINNFENSAF